jgi:hypothetical protein
MYDIETLAAYLHYRLNILNPICARLLSHESGSSQFSFFVSVLFFDALLLERTVPAYLQLLPPGALPTTDIEAFLGALAGRMGMVKKGAAPDVRRAAAHFVRWWRAEGGLLSAASALGVADPALAAPGVDAAITHGWGFDLEWQLRAEEVAGAGRDGDGERGHAALVQAKMEACIDAHLGEIERQEANENNVSATQRKKQQAAQEQMQRKLKYEQKYPKR